MAIQTTARPLTIATLALAAVLAAGCQSTTRTSSVDRTTTMGASAPAHATTGPGTVNRSGTNGGGDSTSNSSGTSPAAPGTSGSGATGAGAGSTGTGGSAGSGGTH